MQLKESAISVDMQHMKQKATLTPREASKELGLSRRQVERLAQPGGPLEAVRRDPILIDAAKVAALKAIREGVA